jgi:ABC-2 type transport system permease protein
VADGFFAPYAALIGSRVRSQLSYRTSFAADALASFASGAAEFVEIYAIFHSVPQLGGFGFGASLLLFGLANLGFALGDLIAGHVDDIPTFLRTGDLDVLLVRPLSLLGQLVSNDVSLRRLGRASTGAIALVAALFVVDVPWTPARAGLLLLTPLTGAALFAAVFVLAGALQFWLLDGSELTNAFSYGGSYAAGYPASLLALPLRLLFTFVVPAAFVGYLPTLAILGLPGPPGVPTWLAWWTPAVTVLFWLLVLGAWRLGVRHYTGGGG